MTFLREERPSDFSSFNIKEAFHVAVPLWGASLLIMLCGTLFAVGVELLQKLDLLRFLSEKLIQIGIIVLLGLFLGWFIPAMSEEEPKSAFAPFTRSRKSR